MDICNVAKRTMPPVSMSRTPAQTLCSLHDTFLGPDSWPPQPRFLPVSGATRCLQSREEFTGDPGLQLLVRLCPSDSSACTYKTIKWAKLVNWLEPNNKEEENMANNGQLERGCSKRPETPMPLECQDHLSIQGVKLKFLAIISNALLVWLYVRTIAAVLWILWAHILILHCGQWLGGDCQSGQNTYTRHTLDHWTYIATTLLSS